MSIATLEKDALALLLRSKTALGRLTESEVHGVLEFLESNGWVRLAAAPEPAPEPIEPPPPIVPPAPPAQ